MNEQKGPAAHNDAVIRADGATPSERYLAKLCQHSFLSLWSHSGVFRDQGRRNGKGDGKEVCDLLVVFENHIIIRRSESGLGSVVQKSHLKVGRAALGC
jgi:hypothetical protein